MLIDKNCAQLFHSRFSLDGRTTYGNIENVNVSAGTEKSTMFCGYAIYQKDESKSTFYYF